MSTESHGDDLCRFDYCFFYRRYYELMNENDDLHKLRDKLKESEYQIDNLGSMLETFSRDNLDLQATIDNLKKENSKLTFSYNWNKGQGEELEQQNKELKDRIAYLETLLKER